MKPFSIFLSLVLSAIGSMAGGRQPNFILLLKDYEERGVGARFNRTTSNAMEITPLIEQMFNQLYVAGREYRSTSVVLGR